MIVEGSGSGQNLYFKFCIIEFNKKSSSIDKIFLYAKDSYEAEYWYLIYKCEKSGLDHFNDPKVFIEYSYDMQDLYRNIE